MSARKGKPDGRLAWCWLQHGGAALMLQQADEKLRTVDGTGDRT
jgi:hypothetical protein